MTPEDALEITLRSPKWEAMGGLDASTIYGELAIDVARVAVTAEREACAQIADLYSEKAWPAADIAADIRSRR